MNKELKNRNFDLPLDVLEKINHTVIGLNGQNVHGVMRAKKLLSDKKVTYGQLKRIIHDIQGMDKIADRVRYDLAGGDLMDSWSKQYLKGERDLIKNRKEADDISSTTGERKNSFLKKHRKKSSWLPSFKFNTNSEKNSISSIKLTGLFEQVERIKKLML
jgi:hypothetical protein